MYKYILKNSLVPQWLSNNWIACNAGDAGSIPGLGGSPGGENDNPLLENQRDSGSWWTTVHEVTKSSTRLSNRTHPFVLYDYILLIFTTNIRELSIWPTFILCTILQSNRTVNVGKFFIMKRIPANKCRRKIRMENITFDC